MATHKTSWAKSSIINCIARLVAGGHGDAEDERNRIEAGYDKPADEKRGEDTSSGVQQVSSIVVIIIITINIFNVA